MGGDLVEERRRQRLIDAREFVWKCVGDQIVTHEELERAAQKIADSFKFLDDRRLAQAVAKVR